MAKTYEGSAQLLESLDPKLKELVSKLPPKAISRLRELLKRTDNLNWRINPNRLVKYAVLLVTVERDLSSAAVSREHTARARAEQAGEYYAFTEGYERQEEAWRQHSQGRKARQRIAASLTGIRRSWKKTQQVIQKNRPDLPLHVQDAVSDENLKVIAEALQEMFWATELPDPLKKSTREKQSTLSVRTFMLWDNLIPKYRGKWTDMHELAHIWKLTTCRSTDSFRRIVRKNSSDPGHLSVSFGSGWIAVFAENAKTLGPPPPVALNEVPVNSWEFFYNGYVSTQAQKTPAASARPKRVRLALEHITLDEKLQSRELKPGVVNDYAAIMRRGGIFPPVRVVRDGHDKYYLVDGHHRVAAARQLNGVDVIETEIVDGTFTDALWLSWGANGEHGLRRTQKEKRRSIWAALQHPKWGKKSNRAIGLHIGCDHKTVAAIRRSRAAGEFPNQQSASSPHTAPSKHAILRACRVLANVRQEQNYEFNTAKLTILKAGYEAMEGLGKLHGG